MSATLAGVLIFVGIVILGLKVWVRRLLHKLHSALPVVRITTVHARKPIRWVEATKVRRHRVALEKIGFAWLTDLEIEEVMGLHCRCFLNAQGVAALVYDHPQQGCWVDMVVGLDRRGVLSTTSREHDESFDVPPFSETYSLPSANPAHLWAVLQEKMTQVEGGRLRPFHSDDLFKRIEEYYADETDWRNTRLPSRAQVRAALEGQGLTPTAKEVEETWELGARHTLGLLERGLKLRCRESLPQGEAESPAPEELVLVHDLLSGRLLLERLAPLIEDDEYEPVELPPQIAELPARRAVEVLLELLPAEVRLEKVGELDFPVGVDLYLPPEHPLPVDLFPHRRKSSEDGC